mmetsp:Transcript_10783/g.24636  ORF Transcript_10783/g.24636 Transcript_10783/m.24636 type:complete len:350 (+) Transcript_10783:133-1182(+)|eukprot:CAMPEP_0178443998 /NCGR_PEP_ID=MMETSP0689_2-20121128/39237_1 /TAXON_ID=160604 /ORGANISM="Amphidinium massartii, Strain CS-259" /LENGTH=349 /DNA_ID=CAMNT_0020068129 /DNA_START=63 /DNA_END=1112 /DNA_ORIENTATION=+
MGHDTLMAEVGPNGEWTPTPPPGLAFTRANIAQAGNAMVDAAKVPASFDMHRQVSAEEPCYLGTDFDLNSSWVDSWSRDVPAKVPLPQNVANRQTGQADFNGLVAELTQSCLNAEAAEFEFASTYKNAPQYLNDMEGDISSWDGDKAAFFCEPEAYAHSECRWHNSAKAMGTISEDGHIFTKVESRGKKSIVNNRGNRVELSPLCMVFDSSLRKGGMHQFHYQILDGEIGAADGAGFVFDKQVRRNNIQRIRSVFLNQRGRICVRNNGHVTKLGGAPLPPLSVGMSIELFIDLDAQYLRFAVLSSTGELEGAAEVSLDGHFGMEDGFNSATHSGFFCAVVTKDICVSII